MRRVFRWLCLAPPALALACALTLTWPVDAQDRFTPAPSDAVLQPFVPQGSQPSIGSVVPQLEWMAPASPVQILDPVLRPFTYAGPKPPDASYGPPAPVLKDDKALPIDLGAALRLVNARSLDIAVAVQQVEKASAQYDQIKYSWLPLMTIGTSYGRSGGNDENSEGIVHPETRNNFNTGVGLNAVMSPADFIYYALAQRQVVQSKRFDRIAATNDTTLAVAQAYFNVQQARGELYGAEYTVKEANKLVEKTKLLAPGLALPVEVVRARAELARRRQAVATAEEHWRVASDELVRILRLDPMTRINPTEAPHLQISLIALDKTVDELIPIGLRNRPELASQRALVEAALLRLQAERLRPLIPSLVLTGTGPDFTTFSLFGGGNDATGKYQSRADVDVQVVWKLEGFGLVNLAKIKERRSDRDIALLNLFHQQDQVAADVAQAFAQAKSAQSRLKDAEEGLKDALESLDKNFQGLQQTHRVGDFLILLIRPQEVVAAEQALANAYLDYFGSVADYNRSQFLLFRALGYPTHIVTGFDANAVPPTDRHPHHRVD